MRITVVHALVALGAIAFGTVGLMPFLGSANSFEQRVVAQRIPLRTFSPDPASNEVASVSTASPSNEVVVDSKETDQAESKTEEAAVAVALQKKVDALTKGLEFLKTVPHYSATLQKQEVVGGVLLDEQTIALKCRHQPFSVYLLWLTGDTGREVIYVEGQNSGKMIAHDGGWRARIPAFTLSTECMLAMRDARYPVTKAGIAALMESMLDIHQSDLQKQTVDSCQLEPDQVFNGRPCHAFTTFYKSESHSPEYRKSITVIDREWNILLASQHFEWPKRKIESSELDVSTMIESYAFADLNFDSQFTDDDFDRKNPEYRFR